MKKWRLSPCASWRRPTPLALQASKTPCSCYAHPPQLEVSFITRPCLSYKRPCDAVRSATISGNKTLGSWVTQHASQHCVFYRNSCFAFWNVNSQSEWLYWVMWFLVLGNLCNYNYDHDNHQNYDACYDHNQFLKSKAKEIIAVSKTNETSKQPLNNNNNSNRHHSKTHYNHLIG